MSIIAENFYYNGKMLSYFSTEYMIVDIDNLSRLPISSRTMQTSMLTNDSPLTYFYGTVGSNVITFDITICRKDEKYLTVNNCKELSDWLLSVSYPKQLNFTLCNYGVLQDTVFIGMFTASSYIQSGNERKQAMVFTFQNISPYGFTQIQRFGMDENYPYNMIVSSGSKTGEVIYPTIAINPRATGTVTINNIDDTSVGPFSIEVEAGIPIIVEDRNLYTATAEYDSVDKRTYYYKNGPYSFSHLNNFNWLGILDSINNNIEMTGSADVVLSMRFYKNLLF